MNERKRSDMRIHGNHEYYETIVGYKMIATGSTLLILLRSLRITRCAIRFVTWILAIVEGIAEIFVREYCDALLLIPA